MLLKFLFVILKCFLLGIVKNLLEWMMDLHLLRGLVKWLFETTKALFFPPRDRRNTPTISSMFSLGI